MSVVMCSDLSNLSEDARAALELRIVDTVAASRGCRACDLTHKLLASMRQQPTPIEFSLHGLRLFIDRMVSEGQLRAEPYTLPGEYSIRYMLYPAGTI